MKRRILSLVLCFVMVFGVIGTASAKPAQSKEQSCSLNGRTYKRWAELDVNDIGFIGYACVSKTSGKNAPAGSLRAMAELYNNAGKLITTTWDANQEGANSVRTETAPLASGRPVYSKGTVGILNEKTGDFDYYTAGPAAQADLPSEAKPKTFTVNSHGSTYGTALFAEEMKDVPDLISAVGLYGAEGYVKKEELYPSRPAQKEAQKEAPEEIQDEVYAKIMAKGGKVRWIPLYDSEENQIGLYEIGDAENTYGNNAKYQAKLAELSKKWSVNSLGMTYGNAFDAVGTGGYIYEPTLIAAVGRDKDGNEVTGYILSKRESAETVTDVLNWSKTVKELPIPFFIAPLYNSEFEQIGGFRIGGAVPVEGEEQDAFWALYFNSLEG